jgi:hypothetical protein
MRLRFGDGEPEDKRSRLILVAAGSDNGSARGAGGERTISCEVVAIGICDTSTREEGAGERGCLEAVVFRPGRRGRAESERLGSAVVVAIGTCQSLGCRNSSDTSQTHH